MSVDSMMREMISQAVAPLQLEIRQLREQLETMNNQQADNCEVKGIKRTLAVLGITDKRVIAAMLKCGVLGLALWKKPTKRGNGKVYCTPSLARQRYRHLMLQDEIMREAWYQLGIDNAEQKWKELGL